jgi:predicted patatin/cPLA2 family phospholipase
MRGIFTAGVMDAFFEAGFDPFDIYLGASSGALNVSNFLSGQHERNYRIITTVCTEPGFINTVKFLKGGNQLDLDWLFEQMAIRDPFDVEAGFAALGSQKKLMLVATDAETANAVYLEPGPETWEQYALASCALPLIYRTAVNVDGRRLFDGGVADPIPFGEAFRMGARNVMVLRTRKFDYRKKTSIANHMMKWAYRQYPALGQMMADQAIRYNHLLDQMRNPAPGLNLIEVCPPPEFRTSRLTQDLDILNADYEKGKAMGKWAMEEWERRV